MKERIEVKRTFGMKCAMRTLHQSLLITLGGLTATAYAQVPSTNDTSDQYFNTGMGTNALFSVIPQSAVCANVYPGYGACNTAAGYEALYSNTIGTANTAAGYQALYSNTTGEGNAAFGQGALYYNTTGEGNAAFGQIALWHNTTGDDNTAIGGGLAYNTTGNDNTATGYGALGGNQTANGNTAMGAYALFGNSVGVGNTAVGYLALEDDLANENTALGMNALFSNRGGAGNTASGYGALASNKSGRYNIANGYRAGYNLTTGSYNIDIGHLGVAAESGVIRIGTSGQQTQAFIAGVENAQVTGSAVYVTSAGQLGVLALSERFKTAIAPMGSDTSKLGQLRPVTFKLKSDSTRTRQYGLIAEEVAKVYPELVIRNEKGGISGVRYDELAPMLLNEVQKQQSKNAALDEHIAAQDARISQLTAQLAEMHAAFEKRRAAAAVAQR